MKIFLSFRYTGETEGGLREFFTPVVESLRKQGHEVHFGLDDIKAGEGQGQTVGQMILAGLEKLSEYDMLFCAVALLAHVRLVTPMVFAPDTRFSPFTVMLAATLLNVSTVTL
jgi:hypothetical protein